jgi:adenosylhomocysteine nucleosidase
MDITIEERIQELLKPLPSASGAVERRSCDLLLFVAIRSEHEALLRRALEMGLPVEKVHGRESEYTSLGTLGRRHVMLVRTTEGPFSYGGSASKAIHCMTETQAAGLISVGMAFGTIPSAQRAGDVLVSTGILPYDAVEVRSTRTRTAFHDYADIPRLPANDALLDECRMTADLPEWKGKVHIGLMLSGAAKIFCPEYRDRLARKCEVGRSDLIVGGEMEGVGIASASPEHTPNWIIVKAISDFADHDRDALIRESRVLACRNAVEFVFSTISRKATP